MKTFTIKLNDSEELSELYKVLDELALGIEVEFDPSGDIESVILPLLPNDPFSYLVFMVG